MRTPFLLQSFAFCLILASASRAQDRGAEISGRITDTAGVPIAFATVSVVGTRVSAGTDVLGIYHLRLKAKGTYRIEARRLGYKPRSIQVTVDSSNVVAPDIQLSDVAGRLDPVRVRETAPHPALARQGFYDRMLDANRGMLYGIFITPEELESRRPSKASQILQGLRGVRIEFRRTQRGGEFAFPLSNRRDCLMNVYVDGARFFIGPTTAAGSGGFGGPPPLNGPGIDYTIPMNQIAAIEVYPTATQAPPQFQLTNSCGVILFWTKSG